MSLDVLVDSKSTITSTSKLILIYPTTTEFELAP
jgi:hypothetical protein